MTAPATDYRLPHLEVLEAEAIHIFREVAAEMERPCLLFSGGKDSIVMLRLAEKAFYPAAIPFPVMHIDTGQNFPEVLEFRDRRVGELGVQLIVASVQEAIDRGLVREEPNGSRNRIQTPVLLDAVEKHRFNALFGGARRDEEKARAKERVFSFRDEFGQWDPKNQRPELWSLYNGRVHLGESIRVFPLSNWTELDIWLYVAREGIALPSIYFAHEREVFDRAGMLMAVNEHADPKGAPTFTEQVRYRTVGDANLTACVRSEAATVQDIVAEVASTRITERGATRGDDRVSEAAMEGPQAGGVLLVMSAPTIEPAEGLAMDTSSEMLRFATAGSVDDGKSTLIGRLLYDAKAIFDDQLEAVEATSARMGDDYTNLALLTDGLRAEREQGITIDVAYRYFATPRRKFVIADTPGHIQYTRNMVTGASTADLAIVLVDARKGLVDQSRRHAFLVSLLRVPHLVLAVNKMDLVDYSEQVFERVRAEFTAFATKLAVPDLTVIPMSALVGDNVVERSARMPWYQGSSLLHHLENVHVASDRNLVDARFPVQYVLRPQSNARRDYRGYAGQVAGGIFKPGDEVMVLPSGFTSRVASIDTFDGPVEQAFPPMSVVVRLEDEIDVSRGDMICRIHNQPRVSQDVDATVCWMDESSSLVAGKKYGIKHTTRSVRCIVRDLQYRLDINTLHRQEGVSALALNEIGRVTLRTTAPLLCDDYGRKPGTPAGSSSSTRPTTAPSPPG